MLSAAIWLDGDSTGYAIVHLFEDVRVGTHTVRLAIPGYIDWIDEITVTEGDTTYVDTNLEPLGRSIT